MTTKQIVDYSVTDAAIAELQAHSDATIAELGGIDIGTGAEYEAVKAVEAPIRSLRVKVEGKRKELKADALAWGKLVDTEAKRITAALRSAEDPAKALRLKWDAEKDRIKAEKEAAIKARMDYFTDAIEWMQRQPLSWHGLSLAQLQEKQAEYNAIELGDSWEEFAYQASVSHQELLDAIDSSVASKAEAEEAAAAQRAEAERIANERAKLDAEQAAAKRLADEERREINEAREKFEAEQAQAKAAIEKAEAEFHAKKAAEQAEKDRVERERQIKEQAKADAKAALEREAAEKLEQEKQAKIDLKRAEELRPDREKLEFYIAAIGAASKDKPTLEHDGYELTLARWNAEIAVLLESWKRELGAGQ